MVGLSAYKKIDRLGEGTYGVVYMAKDRRNGNYVALKRIRETSDKQEGVLLFFTFFKSNFFFKFLKILISNFDF